MSGHNPITVDLGFKSVGAASSDDSPYKYGK